MSQKKDWRGFIDVSGIELPALVRAAYDLSQPQGLGFLHFVEGPLAEEVVDAIVARQKGDVLISTDYILGRAMKFDVWKDPESGAHYINGDWFDHSQHQLVQLLTTVGHPDPRGAVDKADLEKSERASEK